MLDPFHMLLLFDTYKFMIGVISFLQMKKPKFIELSNFFKVNQSIKWKNQNLNTISLTLKPLIMSSLIVLNLAREPNTN